MTIKRITFLQELLSFIGLKGRLHLSWISSAEAGKFVQVINDFTEKIRAMGPNPLKGYDLRPWLERLQPPDNREKKDTAQVPSEELETLIIR
jgi:F420-non-reducing hydrogenase iron-sulfur subunit